MKARICFENYKALEKELEETKKQLAKHLKAKEIIVLGNTVVVDYVPDSYGHKVPNDDGTYFRAYRAIIDGVDVLHYTESVEDEDENNQ